MKTTLLFSLILALSYSGNIYARTPLDDVLNPIGGDFNVHGGVRLTLENPESQEFIKGPIFPPICLSLHQELSLDYFTEDGISLVIHKTKTEQHRRAKDHPADAPGTR